MKTDLHHGLNLAVIRYRLLEWMANLGRWGTSEIQSDTKLLRSYIMLKVN